MRGRLRAFGRHNVYNAVCAFAVGRWVGVSPDNIAKGLESYKSKGLRQNLELLDDKKVLIDCYNASEIAAKSVSQALATITPGPGGKRVLVFGDMGSLGDIEEESHRRLGQYLARQSDIDRLVFYGDLTSSAADEATALRRDDSVSYFNDSGELTCFLRESLRPGDVVAFKASRMMRLERVIDSAFGTALVLEDSSHFSAENTRMSKAPEGTYRIIDDYGAEYYSHPSRNLGGEAGEHPESDENHRESVRVASECEGEIVRIIGRRAFYGSRTVGRVEVGEGVHAIAGSAFRGAVNLSEVVLPSTLRVIYENAFRDCKSLETLVIPEGVTTIKRNAFADCPNLKDLFLPDSVHSIEEYILAYSTNVTVHCSQDSFSAEYMRKHYENREVCYYE